MRFFVLFFIFAPLFSFGKIVELPRDQPKKIIMLSVPKAGTDLIKKTLELITGRTVEAFANPSTANPEVDPYYLDPARPTIGMHHLFPSLDFIKEDKSGKFIKVIMIRDPRDVLLSKMRWIGWGHWYAPKEFINAFNKKSVEQRIFDLITFPEEYWSTRGFFQRALEGMKEPDVHVCRFEDLVGARGKGDRDRQHKAIRMLAEHIGYALDDEDVERVASHVFGGTGTFVTGQIGDWHKVFTALNKELFKRVLGKQLIELGYETDDQW